MSVRCQKTPNSSLPKPKWLLCVFCVISVEALFRPNSHPNPHPVLNGTSVRGLKHPKMLLCFASSVWEAHFLVPIHILIHVSFFNGTSVRGQKTLKCSLPKTQKCSCVVLRRGRGKRASLQEGKIARVGSSGLWSHGKGGYQGACSMCC
jgi:hypothetical protein